MTIEPRDWLRLVLLWVVCQVVVAAAGWHFFGDWARSSATKKVVEAPKAAPAPKFVVELEARLEEDYPRVYIRRVRDVQRNTICYLASTATGNASISCVGN